MFKIKILNFNYRLELTELTKFEIQERCDKNERKHSKNVFLYL